jgi:hypothetical protein
MYSHYANCDPLLEKRIRSPDQVIFKKWLVVFISTNIEFEF